MNKRVHNSPNLIYAVGTQVVTLKQVQGSDNKVAHPAGAVGVIVRAPRDRTHSYRIRFVDGFEAALQTANGLPWLAKALAFEQPKGEADYTSVVYDVLLKKRAPWTASKVRGRFSVVKYLDAGDFVLPCTWLLLAAGW